MSIIATAVKHLMAAGITGEALLAAIAEMEADVRAEPKARSAGAVRQARYEARKRQKASEMTEPDASDGSDATENADKIPPQTPHKNSSTPVTPKGVTAPKGAVRNRGSKIPEDWAAPAKSALPPEARKLAEQWTDASYRAEAEAFVSFWLAETGARAAKSDWSRAWANRIAQIHSKVMRDQKFGNAPTDAPVPDVSIDPLAQAEKTAALYRRMGREDDAREEEQRAARLREGGGMKSIGAIVGGFSASAPP